jgi:hypothetical protein
VGESAHRPQLPAALTLCGHEAVSVRGYSSPSSSVCIIYGDREAKQT